MGFKGSRVRIPPSRPLIPDDLAPREGRFFVAGNRSDPDLQIESGTDPTCYDLRGGPGA